MLRAVQDRITDLLNADDYFKARASAPARPALPAINENRDSLIESVQLAIAKNGAAVVVRSSGGVANEASTPEAVAITETLEVRAFLNLVHNGSKRTLPEVREAIIRAVHGQAAFPDMPETTQDFRFLNHELEEIDEQGNAVAVVRFEVETDFVPTTYNIPTT